MRLFAEEKERAGRIFCPGGQTRCLKQINKGGKEEDMGWRTAKDLCTEVVRLEGKFVEKRRIKGRHSEGGGGAKGDARDKS